VQSLGIFRSVAEPHCFGAAPGRKNDPVPLSFGSQIGKIQKFEHFGAALGPTMEMMQILAGDGSATLIFGCKKVLRTEI
jgi:hypothetical protein